MQRIILSFYERWDNNMYEWNEAIQEMIDWIEENIIENPTLINI